MEQGGFAKVCLRLVSSVSLFSSNLKQMRNMDNLADLGVLMEDFARLQDMTLTIARVDALAHIKLLLYR